MRNSTFFMVWWVLQARNQYEKSGRTQDAYEGQFLALRDRPPYQRLDRLKNLAMGALPDSGTITKYFALVRCALDG